YGKARNLAGAQRLRLCQAARTESRNLPTSSLRRLLSTDSDCAAERTCAEADPVSLAPRCTSVMFELTCEVPWAACWMLREIYLVDAPCFHCCRTGGRD